MLLALVERFRGVRASLGEPIEVATGARDAAIAAAMSTVSGTGASPDPTQRDLGAPNVAVTIPETSSVRRLDDRRSRHATRWLGGAAAAIIAVVVGLSVRASTGSDRLDTASKSAAITAPLDRAVSAVPDQDAGAGAPASTMAAGATTTAARPRSVAAAPSSATAGSPTAAAEPGATDLQQPEQLLDLPTPFSAAATTPAADPMPAASSTAGSTESAGAAAVTIAGSAPTAPPSTAAPSTCVVGTEIVLAVITYRGSRPSPHSTPWRTSAGHERSARAPSSPRSPTPAESSELMRAALLCLVAVAAALDWWSRLPGTRRGARTVELVAKPLTTVLVIALALSGDAPHEQVVIATVALSLCLVGDVALLGPPSMFLVGLGAFLAAHLAFIVLFVEMGLTHASLAGIAVLAGCLLAATVGRVIVLAARAQGAGLARAVGAYLVVIVTMAIVGWATGVALGADRRGGVRDQRRTARVGRLRPTAPLVPTGGHGHVPRGDHGTRAGRLTTIRPGRAHPGREPGADIHQSARLGTSLTWPSAASLPAESPNSAPC